MAVGTNLSTVCSLHILLGYRIDERTLSRTRGSIRGSSSSPSSTACTFRSSQSWLAWSMRAFTCIARYVSRFKAYNARRHRYCTYPCSEKLPHSNLVAHIEPLLFCRLCEDNITQHEWTYGTQRKRFELKFFVMNLEQGNVPLSEIRCFRGRVQKGDES
jgi:hypothetical protein